MTCKNGHSKSSKPNTKTLFFHDFFLKIQNTFVWVFSPNCFSHLSEILHTKIWLTLVYVTLKQVEKLEDIAFQKHYADSYYKLQISEGITLP
jgi:hypothetical protein